jgi:hypothetical protein
MMVRVAAMLLVVALASAHNGVNKFHCSLGCKLEISIPKFPLQDVD